jgi:hypothetical protein
LSALSETAVKVILQAENHGKSTAEAQAPLKDKNFIENS